MSEVTIVCCYNNMKQYDDFVSSLKAQNYPCEIIGIDNRGNKAFTSCSSAYNSVKDQIKTKYVIYSHQDILLTEPDMLGKLEYYLEKINPDDILGVAGATFDKPGTITNIMHKDKDTGELILAGPRRVECGMMECDTLDECLFGGYAEHFRQYPFDEEICRDWHLYAVEACLHTKSNCGLGGGHNVYVCDVPLIHNSIDGAGVVLHLEFCSLCIKYHKDFPFIRTTCVCFPTNPIYINYRRLRIFAGMIFKRLGIYRIMKKILH